MRNAGILGDAAGHVASELNGQLKGQLNDSQKETLEFVRGNPTDDSQKCKLSG